MQNSADGRDLSNIDYRVHLPESMWKPVERLRHITGFVTTVTADGDPRAEVFNRYEHVERVAGLAARLAIASGDVEVGSVMRLAWLHDLNRWPFAHNSEKGFHDQPGNVLSFFTDYPDVHMWEVQQIRDIHRKDFANLSAHGRIVLIADMVTGLIEDPIMITSGLNLHPKFIPSFVSERIGWSYMSDTFLGPAIEAAEALHLDRSPDRFRSIFSELFEDGIHIFDSKHRLLGRSASCSLSEVYDLAQFLKREFLRPVVFPINNEHVCHTSWIRSKIIEPWVAAVGTDSLSRHLLQIDERQFIDEVEQSALFTEVSASDFFPFLDYVSVREPDKQLIAVTGSCVPR